MNSRFTPKFWKPGDDSQSWTEERVSGRETDFSAVTYNSNSAISLEQQRQKLPIFNYRNHILYLLETKQTLVIVGETGCGKSTQIPQYLLETGRAKDGLAIGITQPRRVAATTLASRVADEKNVILGQEVGYSIHFDDCFIPKKTKIKYMTEGILVREMMADPLLRSYSVLMLDEVHERTLYTDIMLGLLKKVLRKRKELKLVVASATFDAEQIRDFFNTNDTRDSYKDTATIMSIEGRTFPVEVFYSASPFPDYIKASVETVIKIHEQCPSGDVLVFLTGQEEVQQAIEMLITYACSVRDDKTMMKMYILPMYGALPAADQLKVFKPMSRSCRKVVVATNIAEASITIHGIVYVVDCGFVKLRYFNANTSTDVLAVVPISQASANQRAGRAGRLMPGKTYRLYTEESFKKLALETSPEIQRSDLCTVLLQLKAMGIENILRFNFPAPPPSSNVVSALELLYALGAIDDDCNLTDPLGTKMAEFPLHPMFSKMLLVSADFGCSEEAIIVVAMLQVQNIFLSPQGRTAQARKAKYQFSVSEGDHLTLLNVFLAFVKSNKSKKWCDSNYLNYKGLMRAVEIQSQIRSLLKKFNYPMLSCDGDVDAVCLCIVSGFFANSAYLHHSGVYKTIRGDHTLHIHPSSVLYTQKPPGWVIFNEVLQTNREYMRDVTVVEPDWLYSVAPHYYQFGTDRQVAEQEARGKHK